MAYTPRFTKTPAPSLTSRYAGMEAGIRDAESRGLHTYGYNLKNIAAGDLLTVSTPVASVDIGQTLTGGGTRVTFTAPKSYGSLYSGGAAMGTGAEYLRLRNAQTQNYLTRAGR